MYYKHSLRPYFYNPFPPLYTFCFQNRNDNKPFKFIEIDIDTKKMKYERDDVYRGEKWNSYLIENPQKSLDNQETNLFNKICRSDLVNNHTDENEKILNVYFFFLGIGIGFGFGFGFGFGIKFYY